MDRSGLAVRAGRTILLTLAYHLSLSEPSAGRASVVSCPTRHSIMVTIMLRFVRNAPAGVQRWQKTRRRVDACAGVVVDPTSGPGPAGRTTNLVPVGTANRPKECVSAVSAAGRERPLPPLLLQSTRWPAPRPRSARE